MELPFNTTDTTAEQQQPVTVLGRTFANDEERRTYFREELRKQLPELKKIEGFPIGEDEDILKLSDPPYYTACPNPWINDFIAEWENEKAELQAQGKRVADFEVDEPYAGDVSEGKNNPIYNAHSYHTKVPHPAIMRYILHYTQPGDIVFDGFAGTGMTGVAAGMCRNPDKEIKATIEKEFKSDGLTLPNWGARHAVCGDLSPVASLISSSFTIPKNTIKYVEKVDAILNELKLQNSWMYETFTQEGLKGIIDNVIWSDVFICPECGAEIVFWDYSVDYEKQIIKDQFNCKHCATVLSKKILERKFVTIYDKELKENLSIADSKPVLIEFSIGSKRFKKLPDNKDFELINKINSYSVPFWFPMNRMMEGSEARRNDKVGITHSHLFYSKRNLIVLSNLYKIGDKSDNLSEILPILTASVVRATMTNRFRFKGTGNLSGTLYMPSLKIERSALGLLKSKCRDLINAEYIKLWDKNVNLVTLQSATDYKNINFNSIDYIFTDPPFGSNIFYSELNFLSEEWLRLFENTSLEAIENSNIGKTAIDYIKLMTSGFHQFYNILKPSRWMTVEFSNTNASIWNGIQTSIQKAGFVIANVAALDKQQGTFKAINTVTAVKQDLVISCYKPSSDFDTKFQQSQNSEVGIWDFVAEHLHHLPVHVVKENATTAVIERSPKILFDRLIAFYVQRNLPVPIDAGLFQKGLRERFIERDGMYFTAEQAHQYDSKKAEVPRFVQLSLLVGSEQEGVLWLRRELENPQTYQELQPKWMQALAGARKGDIIPELRDMLEDNFLQNEAGAWYIPDMENEIDLEKVRTRRLLKQFDAYREQASKPKGKIKEARVEALRAGFKQCYKDKDFKTIVTIGDCIPNNLLMEDEVLLQYYDIAISRV